MPIVPSKPLLFSCLYLGVLFAVAGTLFHNVHSFSGTLFLPGDSTESLVFRAAQPGWGIGLSQRAVPPDLLLLQNPGVARVLHRDATYDAVVMPFTLRLESAVVGNAPEPVHALVVSGPEHERTIAISEGDALTLAGEPMRVTRLGGWEGLLRNASGPPMAALSIRGDAGDAGPVLMLESGEWLYPARGLAIYFAWHADEATATAAYRDRRAEIQHARWGVRDGRAIQWFQSTVPGSGTRLRDGRRVQLLEFRPEAIRVEVREGNVATEREVPANVHDPDAAIFFESPAAASQVLMLHAWSEDRVTGRLLNGEQPARARALAPGETWDLPGGMAIRPEQLLPSAIPVRGEGVGAAYLRAGARTYTLREGQVETIGDIHVRYRKDRPPPRGRYTIVAEDPAGAAIANVSLAEGNSARIGSWVFSLAEENPFAPHGIALDAVRRPGGTAQIVGIALFLAGSFGLVIARYARNPPAA